LLTVKVTGLFKGEICQLLGVGYAPPLSLEPTMNFFNLKMAQAHDLVNAVAVFKLSGEGYVAASTGHRPLQLLA
jgi:hypothetical protein